MFKQKQQAFTLIELIVVITILAILGTIAFIAMNGYSKTARDSTRTSDMSKIKTSLELFHLNSDKYPDPTELQPITYSGGLAWYQGIFGNSTFMNVEKLDKIPKDPLTDKEYAYSVLNTKQEYEIAGIMEGDNTALNIKTINQTNAVEKTAKAKIIGTYNGVSLRVNANNTSYILAIPSIITSINLSVELNRKLETIIPQKELVIANFENLPSNYINSLYNSNKETTNADFELIKDNDILNVLVYEGNLDNLTPTELITKLQDSYSGTTVATVVPTKELFNIDITTASPESIDTFGVHFINNNLGGSTQSKIYATCNGIAHNTTQSYYSTSSVLFGISCDTVKKDFTCIDGVWIDQATSEDISGYPETSCSVDLALNCTYLTIPINHGENLTVYSVDTLLWDATENCTDGTIEGTVTCNNGTNEGDTGYGYLTCTKGTPLDCDSRTQDGYTIDSILHGNTLSITKDILITNGTETYDATALCSDNTVSISGEVKTLTCDSTFHTEDNNTCVSDTRSCTITNGIGTQTWNGTSWNTCTIVTCNSGYYDNTTTCEPQWTGDGNTTGYLFKNTSGVEQYPTSCSDLLVQTTWKNTLVGTPWNGSSFSDGVYWIKPTTDPAFKAYCDMTTDGGGWTMITEDLIVDYGWATLVNHNFSCYQLTTDIGGNKVLYFEGLCSNSLGSHPMAITTIELPFSFIESSGSYTAYQYGGTNPAELNTDYGWGTWQIVCETCPAYYGNLLFGSDIDGRNKLVNGVGTGTLAVGTSIDSSWLVTDNLDYTNSFRIQISENNPDAGETVYLDDLEIMVR